MIPIRDENPTRRTPFVTVSFILANCLVFFYQISLPPSVHAAFILQFGAVPNQILSPSAHLSNLPVHWLPIITSMFLHGGLFHLGGNMLYLWIFGNNIEDRLGHIGFVFFYLAGGIAAAFTHILMQPNSTIPMVGASGAISAVLGAYMILYPRARVVLLIWFFIFIRFVRVPAFLVLGIWFAMQISGVFSSPEASIAWYAHIGGFLAGVILIMASGKSRKKQP
ncbi:rhomboid family intramembrane serine protease [bacterium]|nr:rhomboid family intramembrane serine protease [bacterium]MBU1919913.1 rhomboid family intramembrane serine protease [bacterium]